MNSQELPSQTNNNTVFEEDLIEKIRLDKIKEEEEDAKKLQDMLDFTKMKKKKRKPIVDNQDEKKSCEEKLDEPKTHEDNTVGEIINNVTDDPPYNYEEHLLPKLYKQLEAFLEKEGLTKEKKIVKPITPVITTAGGRKTKFSNYEKFIKSFQTLNIEVRTQHVQNFLDKELCCTSNFANSVLTLYGKFKLQQIENVLKTYLINNARCETCGNLNTLLQKCKNTGHYNIKCDLCNSNAKYL